MPASEPKATLPPSQLGSPEFRGLTDPLPEVWRHRLRVKNVSLGAKGHYKNLCPPVFISDFKIHHLDACKVVAFEERLTFKTFPIQSYEHLLTVVRYVERNSVRAKTIPVRKARYWNWSSAGTPPKITKWSNCTPAPALRISTLKSTCKSVLYYQSAIYLL